jgi:hypothetical protein
VLDLYEVYNQTNLVDLLRMMGKALEHILERYPDHNAKIIDLYSKDEDFRILCEDHFTISQGIEKYRLNVLRDKEYKNEFVRVYLDLEKEMIHILERI